MRSPPIDHSGTATHLGPRVIQRGAELLHAQCWLWGQDLRSPSGDLLRGSGLRPGRFEGARSHRKHYLAEIEGDHHVVAWSGGLLFGDPAGSLFFPRLRFSPLPIEVRSLETVPDLNALPPATGDSLTPDSLSLLRAAIGWLAAYEDGVARLAGPEWRRECAKRWAAIEEGARDAAASVGVRYEPLAPLPDDGLADAWRALSRTLPVPVA